MTNPAGRGSPVHAFPLDTVTRSVTLVAPPSSFVDALNRGSAASIVALERYDELQTGRFFPKARLVERDVVVLHEAPELPQGFFFRRGDSPLKVIRGSPLPLTAEHVASSVSASPCSGKGSPTTPKKQRLRTRSSPCPTPQTPARVIRLLETAPAVKVSCCFSIWPFSICSSSAKVSPLRLDVKLTDSKRDEKDLLGLINSHTNFTAYRGIPESDLYKLFIDQKRWAGNPGNPALIYKTRHTFDVREPGYLRAMKRAFSYLMQFDKGYCLSESNLDENFTEELHSLCVKDVSDAKFNKPLRAYYRQSGIKEIEAFGLKSEAKAQEGVTTGVTITRDGALELCQRLKAPEYRYKIYGKEESEFHAIADALTPECAREFKDYKKYCDALDDAILDGRDVSSIEEVKFPERMALQFIRPGASIKPLVNQVLHVFHEAPKENETQKLRAIARLIQDLDQIHPFYDGNIRVFAILLINRLLFDLDLSPTCIEDPNCFDGLSLSELVAEIRKGQTHFASLRVS